MFPIAGSKTAMRDAVFIFYFIGRKTAMRNLFINWTRRNIHKHNAIGRGLFFLIFVWQVSQKQTPIFDLSHKHNWCLQHVQVKHHFVFYSGIAFPFPLLMILDTHITKRRKLRANLVGICSVWEPLETYLFLFLFCFCFLFLFCFWFWYLFFFFFFA